MASLTDYERDIDRETMRREEQFYDSMPPALMRTALTARGKLARIVAGHEKLLRESARQEIEYLERCARWIAAARKTRAQWEPELHRMRRELAEMDADPAAELHAADNVLDPVAVADLIRRRREAVMVILGATP